VSTSSKPAGPSSAALWTLLGTGTATSALAVYQWLEFMVVIGGGKPACALNETVNCATVWTSEFSSRVQDTFGMPIAALGLVWGLSATALAAVVFWNSRMGKDASRFLAAVKVMAAAGLLSCVTFASASFASHAVCLTCLGTYALVGAYAFAAYAMLPLPRWPSGQPLQAGVAWAAIFTAVCFLAMLYPGSRSKKLEGVSKIQPNTAEADLIRQIETLPERDRAFTAMARAEWLKAQVMETQAAVRLRWGPAEAPVKLVDFTDILCSHCALFEMLTAQLEQVVPQGRLSVEPRYFPLDAECNKGIQRNWGDGIRCLGAKVQLCLESSPSYWSVRRELFANQQTLTKERIVEIATTTGGVGREALMACVESPETQKKLNDDILYAMKYQIDGTPLVLLNGKVTPPAPAFILGMAVSGGDANAPFFLALPPPPPPQHE
jgi:protein-disulfide isomerase